MKHHTYLKAIVILAIVVGLLCASCEQEDQDCAWGFIPLPGKHCTFWRFTIPDSLGFLAWDSFEDFPFGPDEVVDVYVIRSVKCGVDTIEAYRQTLAGEIVDLPSTPPFQIQFLQKDHWYQAALSICPKSSHFFVSSWTDVCLEASTEIP